MNITRRTAMVGLGGAAGLAAAGCATPSAPSSPLTGPVRLDDTRPLVIAHRGASGERPEHTLMAYKLAIAQGADVIEPDLVLTKDGVLVARHENEISGTTDVASRAEFAARKARKSIDGETVEGWFTEDFTLAELKTLRCRERLPELRAANTAFDGQETIPTFDEVIALAKASGVGIYPETKHPSYFADLGLDFQAPLLADLERHGWNSRQAPVFVQSFEVGNLKRLSQVSELKLIQLMAADGGPWDHRDGRGWNYSLMASYRWMAGASYLHGVGPQKTMVRPWGADERLEPETGLVADAHRLGLKVHPWTVRRENVFLPADFRRMPAGGGEWRADIGDVGAEVTALLDAGVDGFFTDNIPEAVAARAAWAARVAP